MLQRRDRSGRHRRASSAQSESDALGLLSAFGCKLRPFLDQHVTENLGGRGQGAVRMKDERDFSFDHRVADLLERESKGLDDPKLMAPTG